MKTLTISVPETLDEFREYYRDRNLSEMSIRERWGFEYRTVGWQLLDSTGSISKGAFLTVAYERLFVKELVADLFGK